MNRLRRLLLLAPVAVATLFGTASSKAAEPLLKIGTVGGALAEIMDFAAKHAKASGLEVKVVEFSDWITPNEALRNGDIDANLFQHVPFLNAAIEARGYKFTPLAPTYVLPVGLYSKKITKFEELRNGANVAIANDPINEARGLLLFEKVGLIKLREGAGEKAMLQDVIENKKKLNFIEVEAPQLARALDDVDLAQVSISYLIANGGNPESMLAADGFGDPRYALQFVARADKANDERLARFIGLFRSNEVKDYIKSKYGRFTVPVW